MRCALVTRRSPKARRESLARLLLEAILYNKVDPYASLEWARRYLSRSLDGGGSTKFLALFDKDDEALGFISFCVLSGLGGKEWIWLNEMYVREGRRGKGLGSMLGAELKRIAEERGCSAINASTAEDNDAVVTLARRFGMTPKRVLWLEGKFPT